MFNSHIISIIIPTCNRNMALQQCLSEVLLQTNSVENLEVIITNDATEPIQKVNFSENHPFMIYLNGPRRGPAANRNSAAKKAKGDWLIFIDDDCIPCKNWFSSYFLAIQNSQAKVLEGKTIVDRTQISYDEVAPVNLSGDKLWSCNFAIKTSLFNSIGGFDERFPFPTMEDIDFKDRVKKITPIQFLPDAIVIHPWRKRIAFSNFSGRLKSQAYYFQKNHKKNPLKFRLDRIKIWGSGMILEFIALAGFSFKGWRCYLEKMVFNFCMIFI